MWPLQPTSSSASAIACLSHQSGCSSAGYDPSVTAWPASQSNVSMAAVFEGDPTNSHSSTTTASTLLTSSAVALASSGRPTTAPALLSDYSAVAPAAAAALSSNECDEKELINLLLLNFLPPFHTTAADNPKAIDQAATSYTETNESLFASATRDLIDQMDTENSSAAAASTMDPGVQVMLHTAHQPFVNGKVAATGDYTSRSSLTTAASTVSTPPLDSGEAAAAALSKLLSQQQQQQHIVPSAEPHWQRQPPLPPDHHRFAPGSAGSPPTLPWWPPTVATLLHCREGPATSTIPGDHQRLQLRNPPSCVHQQQQADGSSALKPLIAEENYPEFCSRTEDHNYDRQYAPSDQPTLAPRPLLQPASPTIPHGLLVGPASVRRWLNINVVLPLIIPHGVIAVLDGRNGENTYLFDDRFPSEQLLFSGAHSLSNVWASALRLRIAVVHKCPEFALPAVATIFQRCMSTLLPAGDDTLHLDCCGLVRHKIQLRSVGAVTYRYDTICTLQRPKDSVLLQKIVSALTAVQDLIQGPLVAEVESVLDRLARDGNSKVPQQQANGRRSGLEFRFSPCRDLKVAVREGPHCLNSRIDDNISGGGSATLSSWSRQFRVSGLIAPEIRLEPDKSPAVVPDPLFPGQPTILCREICLDNENKPARTMLVAPHEFAATKKPKIISVTPDTSIDSLELCCRGGSGERVYDLLRRQLCCSSALCASAES